MSPVVDFRVSLATSEAKYPDPIGIISKAHYWVYYWASTTASHETRAKTIAIMTMIKPKFLKLGGCSSMIFTVYDSLGVMTNGPTRE